MESIDAAETWCELGLWLGVRVIPHITLRILPTPNIAGIASLKTWIRTSWNCTICSLTDVERRAGAERDEPEDEDDEVRRSTSRSHQHRADEARLLTTLLRHDETGHDSIRLTRNNENGHVCCRLAGSTTGGRQSADSDSSDPQDNCQLHTEERCSSSTVGGA